MEEKDTIAVQALIKIAILLHESGTELQRHKSILLLPKIGAIARKALLKLGIEYKVFNLCPKDDSLMMNEDALRKLLGKRKSKK